LRERRHSRNLLTQPLFGGVCCSDSAMDSRRLQLLEASERRQLKCVGFEPNFHGDPAVTNCPV
jgi:hypothetical protein